MSKKDLKENKEKKNKDLDSEKPETDKRARTLKLFSVFSVIILIVIVLFVNIIFDKIIGDKLTFDYSATNQNSVSEVTKNYLDSLPADTSIRIVGLMDKPTNLKDSPYEYIVPLLDDYQAKSNGKITVEYMNPETYPSVIKELDPDGMYDLTANTFVVKCNDRVTTISPIDCFTYNSEAMSYGQYVPTGNAVESHFTNAIVSLTKDYSAKAYFVTGLQMIEQTHQQMTNILAALSIDSGDLIASDNFTIPEDCDLLFVCSLDSDITESMAVAMEDYLNAGGKMIVSVGYSPYNTSDDFPHLNQVLNMMNLNIDNYVISENDVSRLIDPSYNYNFLGEIDAGYSTYAKSSAVRVASARPVREYDTPYSYIQVAPVIVTSDQATVVIVNPTTQQATQFANQGVYNVGMYSTFDGMEVPPEVYVFGSDTFTSDSYISDFGYNDANVVLMRNIIRSLVATDDSVFVDAKPLSDYSIDSTKVTANSVTLMTVILMVLLPIGFVIVGTIVYNKRKNL